MRAAWTIFKRETAAYFESPIAYIFAIVFLVLTCSVFMNDFFLISLAEMDGYFRSLPYVLVIFVPALSMRLWAEEKKHNTYELLATLPMRTTSVVIGKYLSSLFVFLLVLSGSLPIPVMLSVLGAPDAGKIAASYAGAGLLGAFFLALGMFISGLTRDQIVAYLLSLMACAAFYLTGHDMFAGVMDGLWPGVFAGSFIRDTFSALPHYEEMTRGIIDLRDLLFFGGLSACFIFINYLSLERDKR